MRFDKAHFAVAERPRTMASGLPTYADVQVGDRINGRWTVEKVTPPGATMVAAVGANSRGERFTLSGPPGRRFPGRIER